jgi:hypothetical protein
VPAALTGVTNVFGKSSKTRPVAVGDDECRGQRRPGLFISGGVAPFIAWLKTLSHFSVESCIRFLGQSRSRWPNRQLLQQLLLR